MKRVLAVVLAVVALGLAFAAGSWVTWRLGSPGGASSVAQRTVLHYSCPMHPSYTSPHDGDCPSCGMRLEPVYAGEAASKAETLPANVLKVSSERQQLIGLRIAPVETTRSSRSVRTVGRVTVDENRVYKLTATVEGVVRSLSATAAGAFVRKEQVLLTFYSTDFLSAQQAYFYALNTLERVSANREDTSEQLLATNAQLRSALDGLRNLGMTDAQLAELAKSRKLTRDIELRSPVTGYVLARNVFPAQRLERGEELYRIADLTRVWVLADVFESDAPYVRPGTRMRVSLAYRQAASIEGRVSDVLPQSDRSTRTARVRLEVDNRDLALRPDMFVDVELRVDLPPALTVPAEAVVDSGRHKTVFVERGNGYFEPRRVEIGWRSDDRVQVVRGLMPGERVVSSGTFLLDSESRMRAAARGIVQMEVDPVCGMELDGDEAAAGGRTSTYRGEKYFFCSDACKRQFDREPDRFTQPPAPAPAPRRVTASPRPAPAADHAATEDRLSERIAAADQGLNSTADDAQGRSIFATDPVCGAEVETTAPGVLKATHGGQTYYFVTAECRAAFVKDPVAYAGSAAAATRSALDPVCGMEVDVAGARKANLIVVHDGRTYYFCSDDCKRQFAANPQRFLPR
jgi:RND family efflux transporter MFP subunit